MPARIEPTLTADQRGSLCTANTIIHAVHGEADVSQKGRDQSGGTMVNYLYDLARVAQNHETFATTKAVAATSEVQALAGSAPLQTLQEREPNGKPSL